MPIELVFIREMRFERDFVSKVHRAWEARLTAFPTARFGRFEAFRRAATSRSAIRRCLLGRH